MIDSVKSYFKQLNDTICFVKSGVFEQDHIKIDGEYHFTENTIYIAPKTPCFDTEKIQQIEKSIIRGILKNSGERLHFHPTNISQGHWFFGFGFTMACKETVPRLQVVGRPIDHQNFLLANDYLIYPHMDIARTAMLHDINKHAIDLQEMQYYQCDDGICFINFK
jgi:hypothetical protein